MDKTKSALDTLLGRFQEISDLKNTIADLKTTLVTQNATHSAALAAQNNKHNAALELQNNRHNAALDRITEQLRLMNELLGGEHTLKHLKVVRATAEFMAEDEKVELNEKLKIIVDREDNRRRVRARR